jgi:shikimate dehydrogenase
MTDPTRICVIGWPVGHSRSPVIHGFWLKHHGIAGEYVKQEVAPEAFPAFLRNLAEHGFVGANITVPHKAAAFEAVDEADQLAQRLGVVNTVYLRNSRLYGTNTDGEGFLASLKQAAPHWRPRGTVLVLGAGGAARAITGALLDDGCERIIIANRTKTRADELARDFGRNITAIEISKTEDYLEEASLMVNATTCGMSGKPPLDLDLQGLRDHAVIADIVYTPLETDLLRRARARGLIAVDGLGMLLHQAVRGFELWFGVRPTVTDELRQVIVADLDRH